MPTLTKPSSSQKPFQRPAGALGYYDETEQSIGASSPTAKESLKSQTIDFLEFLGEAPVAQKVEQPAREPVPEVFYKSFGEPIPSKGEIVFNETVEITTEVNPPSTSVPEVFQKAFEDNGINLDPGAIIDKTVLSGLKATEAVTQQAIKVTAVAGKEAKQDFGFIWELFKMVVRPKEKAKSKDPKKEQKEAEIKAEAQFVKNKGIELQNEVRSVIAQKEAAEDERLGTAGKSADQLNTESGTQKGFRIFDALKSIANRMWILEKNRRSAIEQARNKQKPHQIFKSRAGKMDMRLDAQEGNSTAGNAIKSTG